jgi:hypothetical protein
MFETKKMQTIWDGDGDITRSFIINRPTPIILGRLNQERKYVERLEERRNACKL